MKCYMINPNTGQPCGSEEHLAADCPYNPKNRSGHTEASTNLATDMRTPTPGTTSWGPEYISSPHEPMYMIMVAERDDSNGTILEFYHSKAKQCCYVAVRATVADT